MEGIQTLYHDLTHPLWQAASMAEHYLRDTYTLRVLASFWDLAAQLWYFVFRCVLGALFSLGKFLGFGGPTGRALPGTLRVLASFWICWYFVVVPCSAP